ncbi:MAG: M23 family metallopeptidase [Anaerolineales bacterium]|nr:M23 family metallopeptidase [Anaerolineales bacterium]
MAHSLSRRDFLRVAGVGIGATVLTGSGLAALAGRAPTIDFHGSEGEESMNDNLRQGRKMDQTPIVIEFPLRGEWAAYHTPAERIPSHSTDQLGQRYAYDFVRIDKEHDGWKFFRAPMWQYNLVGVTLDNCYGWAESIYAPFEGTVVVARDGWPERNRVHFLREFALSLENSIGFDPRKTNDLRPVLGNHIILKMTGKEVYAFFAHARTGSVQVRGGDEVHMGQYLADVGHSGNSMAPHLHFHLMDNPNILEANGLPCSFKEYEAFRDDVWMRVAAGTPGKREFIRRAP